MFTGFWDFLLFFFLLLCSFSVMEFFAKTLTRMLVLWREEHYGLGKKLIDFVILVMVLVFSLFPVSLYFLLRHMYS